MFLTRFAAPEGRRQDLSVPAALRLGRGGPRDLPSKSGAPCWLAIAELRETWLLLSGLPRTPLDAAIRSLLLVKTRLTCTPLLQYLTRAL